MAGVVQLNAADYGWLSAAMLSRIDAKYARCCHSSNIETMTDLNYVTPFASSVSQAAGRKLLS